MSFVGTVDLLFLIFFFNDFNKSSNIGKASLTGFSIFLSDNAYRDFEYSYRDLQDDNKKGYPWFFIVTHLFILVKLFYSVKTESNKELSSYYNVAILFLIFNCYKLHDRYMDYSKKFEERR